MSEIRTHGNMATLYHSDLFFPISSFLQGSFLNQLLLVTLCRFLCVHELHTCSSSQSEKRASRFGSISQQTLPDAFC